MTRYGGLGRTRPKKLTSKAIVPVYRENQVEAIDNEVQNTLQAIETGVEKAEETEYHLQAAINASAGGNVAQAHIPTPDTVLSSIQYDRHYPPTFSQPSTYIRFSSTVEDCCACPYNMVEEDDVALKKLNQQRDSSSQCTENQFEELMYFFEETAHAKQPFAAVDNPPVVSYAEMESSFDDGTVEDATKKFGKDVYEHWKVRRTKTGNRPLQPQLKFESGQDTDDGDPYVCFRRREVRQVRKTRGRDAQSAEKLRKLRKELEDARRLVALVRQREMSRKEMLAVERQVFVQRAEVKEMKRKLGIKDDDEDLINQKPKKKTVDVANINRPAVPQLRIPPRPNGQPGDDLQLLEDVQADKENEILRDIKANITKHANWNEGYIDLTRAPLTPTSEKNFNEDFRPAITTEYLPTPPASDSSDHLHESRAVADPGSPLPRERLPMTVRHTTPSEDDSSRAMPSFRRRIGRGGRMLIDRRNMSCRSTADIDPIKLDRFKYDQDDDDDEPIFERDPFDIQIMQHRAYLSAKSRDQAAAQAQVARRLQNDGSATNNGQPSPNNPNGSAVVPKQAVQPVP
ncbi:Enhancer of polycomb-like protein 1 [Arachnomyces sp. PD_36]|nr:Enhancer of polycomb-like protein 1 [Arachnomyces sp. PD_36]